MRLVGSPGRRSAAGAKIRLFDRDTRRLLWYEQVAIWGRQSFHSYYAAAEAKRHFGLGDCCSRGVRVEFCPSGRTAEPEEVQGNSTVVARE